MSIDYLESLFTGMDIIIDKRLKDLSFDKTIVCTIVNIDDKKNGKYRVSDGAIEFIAYSDSNKYQVNDQVLVKIPQGDYSGEKFIEGKYTNENSVEPITYISPLDTVVNISGNLIDTTNTQYGIVANGDIEEKVIWAKGFVDEPLSKITGDGIYDTITLRANFRTLLGDYHIRSGRYGLKLEIYTKASKDTNTLFLNTVILDSSEMFGNPYMFSVYSRQEKSFLINTEGYIHALGLKIYQDKNFIDAISGGKIPVNSVSDNILVKDIELGIGSDLTKVSNNTLKLYSVSDPQYKYYGYTPDTNEKQLGLLWYNKDEDNKYLGFSNGVYDEEYDEREYLVEVSAAARLKAQLGRENTPTDETSLILAANIEEGEQGVIKARNLITKDIHQELINLSGQLSGVSSLYDIVTSFDNSLSVYYDNITQELEKVKADYKNILKYGYDLEQGLNAIRPTLSGSNSKLKEYFTNFNNNSLTMMNNLLKSINDNYSGYLGIYNTYNTRLNKLLEKIVEIINSLAFFNDKLDKYSPGEPFTEPDLSKYTNRYSIYWYRYNAAAAGDDFMPAGWEEMTEFADFGLSDRDNETGFHQVAADPATYATIEMRHDEQEEKFIVVLFYNHVMYKSNQLIFTNADEVPNKAMLDAADALIIEHLDNSYDNYYIYNLTNNLNNIADKSLHRKIRCHYDGLLAGNEILKEADVYWYVPNNDNSMLTADDKWLRDKGFITDKSSKTPLSLTGYDYYYKKISDESVDCDFWYMIKPYYSHTAKKNDIICKVKLYGSEDYLQATVLMSFGIEGTSGTHYTLVITNKDVDKIATTASTGLDLDISLVDYDNEKIAIAANGNESNSNAFIKETSWVIPIQNSNIIRQVLSDNFVGVNIGAKGCGILQTIIGFNVPEQEKFRELTALYPVPYTVDSKYYISGPTHVIYNSLGTLDNMSMFNQKYKLWDYNTNSEITDITWVIDYYVNDNGVKNLKNVNTKLYDFYHKYMPKLIDDRLVPASMYLDNLDCYAVVSAIKDSTTVWMQPIIILQNRYASSLLNDWDGKFIINEENGTILSTMVGAGRKNTDNTFSGVLMGDVATTADATVGEMGIYGYNHGGQSFGFKIDGTAFLGKAGAGRIYFDGNKGVISSPGWIQSGNKYSCSQATGTLLDLDDAQLLLKGSKGYLYFNDNKDGDLKMSLSGLNIQLTDKNNNPSLSGYIDATAKGLVSEFRRTATYYATSTTGSSTAIKQLTIKNFDDGFSSNNAGDNSVNELTYSDILKDGVMIAVIFTNEEKASVSEKDITNADGFITGKEIIRTGRVLSLQIPNTNAIPIWYNGNATGTNNPFEWNAGSTVYFTYDSGHWVVSDSGSYSRIIQTADMIRNEVSSVDGKLSTTITQTASGIRGELKDLDKDLRGVIEVTAAGIRTDFAAEDEKIYSHIDITAGQIRTELGDVNTGLSTQISQTAKEIKTQAIKKANYYCTCSTAISTASKEIRFTKADSDSFKDNEITGISNGFAISVEFTNGNNCESNVTFKLCDNNGSGLFSSNSYGVEITESFKKLKAGDKMMFIYDGTNFVPTAPSESYIIQTAESIGASVSENKLDSKYIVNQGFGWNMTKDGFILTNITNGVSTNIFTANKDGIVIQGNATFTGTVNATGGNIGGWIVGEFTDKNGTYTNSLYRDTGNYRVFLRSDGGAEDSVFGVKKYADISNQDSEVEYPFYIQHDGKIKATSGYIGGWTLTPTSLTAGTEGSQGFIGLWTSYYNDNNYRLRIGSKFSVDRDGNLYCSGGNFSGSIGSNSSRASVIYGVNIYANNMFPTNLWIGYRQNQESYGNLYYHDNLVQLAAIYDINGNRWTALVI